MKKMEDGVHIQQRTSINKDYPIVDSLLIVANGNSATQRIMEDVMPLFTEGLRKRGINTTSLFVSYTDKKINESEFNNRNYAYTLWIYEQDRSLQKLDGYDYLVPLAMKLTDNRTTDNVWIATSVFNDIVKKRFYKEKFAGTLVLILRANGIVK
jgi:aspartate-semialdehyde dehydrogenase